MKGPFFSRQFIEQLPEDTDEAIIMIFDEYSSLLNQCAPLADFENDFIEARAIIDSFCYARNLDLKAQPVVVPNIDRHGIIEPLKRARASALERKRKRVSSEFYSSKSDEYRAFFSKAPAYEFSDDDYTRIQQLITELRGEISASKLIPDDHKRRLTRRLDAMQAELNKKTSDIDRFWGFVAEAGIVARKFGEDLKPINDRVLELGKIVTAVIMAKEGIKALPEIAKILQ